MGTVIHIRRQQDTMNPATLLRLWQAFEPSRGRGTVHILQIGAVAGTWPATVYRACALGYLERRQPGMFRATEMLKSEIRQAKRNKKRVAS